MGRSEPGGEKERELARMTTMVIVAGRRGRDAKLTTGERLTKRQLNRPEQAYLYKTCVKQNTQETTSAREFLSLNPEGIWGVCTRWPPVRIVTLALSITFNVNSSWDSTSFFLGLFKIVLFASLYLNPENILHLS